MAPTTHCFALHQAAIHDRVAVLGLLLKAGASVDERAIGDGRTALHYAAAGGFVTT